MESMCKIFRYHSLFMNQGLVQEFFIVLNAMKGILNLKLFNLQQLYNVSFCNAVSLQVIEKVLGFRAELLSTYRHLALIKQDLLFFSL